MLVDLKEIIEDADTKGLVDLQAISAGHVPEINVVARESSHPMTFAHKFFNNIYLIEAAKSFKDQVIIDLGTGRELDAYQLARVCGARAYISVEPAHFQFIYMKITDPDHVDGSFDNLFRSKLKFLSENHEREKEFIGNPESTKMLRRNMEAYLNGNLTDIPVSLLPEDMLTSLRRLPNNSVTVLASGTDMTILPNDQYAQEVELEIARTLNQNSAFLTIYSRLDPAQLKKDEPVSDNFFRKYIH
jgi:hypothetical protein